jgi:hypothetical protein
MGSLDICRTGTLDCGRVFFRLAAPCVMSQTHFHLSAVGLRKAFVIERTIGPSRPAFVSNAQQSGSSRTEWSPQFTNPRIGEQL